MAGQMQELLLEVSRNLGVVERLLEEVKEEQRDQAKEIGSLKQLVAGLEAGLERDREWTGEERRKVGGRLETGDHTFQLLQQRVVNAENESARAYEVAKDALGAIEAHTSGKHGGPTKRVNRWWKLVELLIPYVVPVIISGLAGLLSYAIVLAKIAAREGHP